MPPEQTLQTKVYIVQLDDRLTKEAAFETIDKLILLGCEIGRLIPTGIAVNYSKPQGTLHIPGVKSVFHLPTSGPIV
jgi:hypothetical protein